MSRTRATLIVDARLGSMPVSGHTRPDTTLPRRLNVFDFEFRMGAGPAPGRRLTAVFQCAIAARDDLESGLEGAVRVCFEQDCRSASSTNGSTTHSDLRQTVESSLITRYRARSSIRFSRNESGLLIDK